MMDEEDSWSLCTSSNTSNSKWTIEYLHRFMFFPSPCGESEGNPEYLAPYQLIRPSASDEDQVAIARLSGSDNSRKRCLLISHGNAGNIFDRVGLFDSLAHYPGDIFCYEYDGFGLLADKPVSIPACRANHLFWVRYLASNGYQQIDLWGESIGGGIVMETLDYMQEIEFSPNPDDLLLPRIDSVYLQSTFSSIRNLLSGMGSVLYYLYSALFLNDLDTQSVLAKFRGSPITFHILHSRVDEVIPYSEARTNYAECIKNKVMAKFWDLGGTHNQVIGLDTIKF